VLQLLRKDLGRHWRHGAVPEGLPGNFAMLQVVKVPREGIRKALRKRKAKR